MKAFWAGFEKRSYDFAYEADELHRQMKTRSKEVPPSKLKWGLGGAAIGGALGALTLGGIALKERKGNLGLGLLAGGASGVLTGGLMGVIFAMATKLGIEEAKRIMAMKPSERKKYLNYLARQGEIAAQDAREWSRRLEERMDRNEKHEELVNAIRGV